MHFPFADTNWSHNLYCGRAKGGWSQYDYDHILRGLRTIFVFHRTCWAWWDRGDRNGLQMQIEVQMTCFTHFPVIYHAQRVQWKKKEYFMKPPYNGWLLLVIAGQINSSQRWANSLDTVNLPRGRFCGWLRWVGAAQVRPSGRDLSSKRHKHANTHTHTHKHTQTHTHSNIHTHTNTHTHTQTHTNTQTHTHTQTQIHLQTNELTHTRECKQAKGAGS